MRDLLYVILLLLLTLVSCKETIMSSDPANTPVSNFEVLWNDFDRFYSHFSYNNVDWDSIYHHYRPQINNKTTDRDLYEIFKEMMLGLEDGHVNLYHSPFPYFGYYPWDNRPNNFNRSILGTYYLEQLEIRENFVSGIIENRVGYLHIATWIDSYSFKTASNILESMKSLDAIIVDVRDNGGGNNLLLKHIVQHFTDDRIPYMRYRYRNGPDHDDFTGWRTAKTTPGAYEAFQKPVFVLTNRSCASTTEDFILAMRQLPQVTVVGDTTAGSSGNPITRELPNGWAFRLSRWQQVDANFNHFEGVGLVPDIPVWITPEEEAANRDTMIDTVLNRMEI